MEQHTAETKNPLLNEVLADDSTEGHEKRLARYSAAKTRQQEVVDHIIQQIEKSQKLDKITGEMIYNPHPYDKIKKQLQDCGSFLVFRHYYQLEKYRLLAGCTCKKHLLCALCAIRRAAKCVAVFSEKMSEVTKNEQFDTFLITFTVKNKPTLSEPYEHLQGAFQKLLQKRKNALLKKPKTDTVFKFVAGAIYSYEVTYSETGFHPHIHMIALVPKNQFKIDEKIIKGKSVKLAPDLWAGLVKDWSEITGDSKIIDVRLIDNEEDKMAALVETFKYALKMSEMDVAVQFECYQFLSSRRMIGSMGALFGVKMPENLNDDLLPGEEKYIDLIYQYSGSNFGYQLLSHGETSIQVSNLSQRFSGRKRKQDSLRVTRPTKENLLLNIHQKSQAAIKIASKRLSREHDTWQKKHPIFDTRPVDEVEWI